jgi:hypothetical protein
MQGLILAVEQNSRWAKHGAIATASSFDAGAVIAVKANRTVYSLVVSTDPVRMKALSNV